MSIDRYNQGFSLASLTKALTPLVIAFIPVAWSPARAAADLLVAPTRVVLDDRARSAEVVLNNIGERPATYRISLEVKRMTAEGELVDVEQPSAADAQAIEMVSYAPRRVTLAPGQPQAIRIAARKPEGLPDGEYRVHMLFRAVPDAATPEPEGTTPQGGFSIQLTPIYGITIPVIVRQGALTATAGVAGAQIAAGEDGPQLEVELTRSGDRSTYGDIRVLKAGHAKPVFLARGVAVYPEVGRRSIGFALAPEQVQALKGAATVQYVEVTDAGERLLAETRVDLR